MASQQLPGFTSASKLPPLPSTTLDKWQRSCSLSPSSSLSEPDYSKWFESSPEVQSFGRPVKGIRDWETDGS